MKTLLQKVAAVERVYKVLDTEIAAFQKESGLHCISGCGECCKKPDIEATPLEFLPLALYLLDEGKAEQALQELSEKEDALCYLFRPSITNFGGLCVDYPYRGLICRLFGYAARRNKEGQKELVTCKIIKECQSADYENAVVGLKKGMKVPVFSEYYSRLSNIDPELMHFYPINEAIKKAIQIVLHHYSYHKRKKRHSKPIPA